MAGVPSAASSLGLAAVPGTLASAGSTIGVNGITSAPAGTAGVNPVSTADTGLLQSTVAQILGLQATAAQQTAEGTGLTTEAQGFTAEAQGAALTASGYAYGAQAANETATGYTAEATAYGQAANIATNNSTIAGVVGSIQTLQQQRQVLAATSTQRAQVAGNGFLEAGSNVSLLQSSVQQGNLGAQQIGTQTLLEQGGYEEEASAATAEQTAATAASAAATTTAAADTAAIGFENNIGATYTNQANNTLANAAQYTAAGQLSTANAANETAALSNYLTQTGTNLSPAGTLALGVLAGNPNLPSTLTTNIPTAAAGTTGLALGEASQLSAEGITPNQEETALINSGQAGQAATIASETAGSTLTNTQITPFGTGINSQSGQFTGFTVP